MRSVYSLHLICEPSLYGNDYVKTFYTEALNHTTEPLIMLRSLGGEQILENPMGIGKTLTRICKQDFDISDCDVELIIQTGFNL